MGLHGLNLDWKRFVTDQTADFVAWEKAAIRAGGSELPVTINMMYDFQGLNYHKFKDLIDVVSWDNYPTWHKEAEEVTALDAALQHDFMRSLMKKPFLLMESCPTSTNWQSVSKLKRPGLLKAASLQAVAHGSDSVQYFQIRQSRGASEKFHGAVIDHYGGKDTRVFREVTETGEALLDLAQIAGSTTKAQAAILHDCESRWAMEDAQGPRNMGLHYMNTVKKVYGGLRKLGVNVDFLDMEESLSGYRIVFAPMLYLFRAGIEEKIRNFVADGGTFVMTYWSGVVDENDLCFLGGTPHGLMDVFGLRSTELDALYDQDVNAGVGEGKTYEIRNFCDLVKTNGAETLLAYRDDFYAGYPALTKNVFGEGEAYYVCADFEQAFYDDFCRKLAEEKGLERAAAEIPEGLDVATREDEKYKYLFVQNYGAEPAAFPMDTETYQPMTGEYDGVVRRFETVVFRKEKSKLGNRNRRQAVCEYTACRLLNGRLFQLLFRLFPDLFVQIGQCQCIGEFTHSFYHVIDRIYQYACFHRHLYSADGIRCFIYNTLRSQKQHFKILWQVIESVFIIGICQLIPAYQDTTVKL